MRLKESPCTCATHPWHQWELAMAAHRLCWTLEEHFLYNLSQMQQTTGFVISTGYETEKGQVLGKKHSFVAQRRVWKFLLPYKYRGSLEDEVFLHVYFWRRAPLCSGLSVLQLASTSMKMLKICRNYSLTAPRDTAENSHCVKKSFLLPAAWNSSNSAPAIQSYILLYQLCSGCPALYKILQGSSHKSS